MESVTYICRLTVLTQSIKINSLVLHKLIATVGNQEQHFPRRDKSVKQFSKTGTFL